MSLFYVQSTTYVGVMPAYLGQTCNHIYTGGPQTPIYSQRLVERFYG